MTSRGWARKGTGADWSDARVPIRSCNNSIIDVLDKSQFNRTISVMVEGVLGKESEQKA